MRSLKGRPGEWRLRVGDWWPERHRASYKKPDGVRYLFGAYAVHAERLHGRLRAHKNGEEVLAFYRQIRMRYDPRLRIYLVADNLSTPAIREWPAKTMSSSRFLALRVRPANIELRRQAHKNAEELPVRWLVCEWPSKEKEPTKYWLSNLPAGTPLKTLVKTREAALADRAGLSRAQGRARPRSLRGPHLPRLEPPRRARFHSARLSHPGAKTLPSSKGGSLTLFQVLRELQALLACWHGTCPTCSRELPSDHPLRAPPT